MRIFRSNAPIIVAFIAMLTMAPPTFAQGKGGEKGQGKGEKPQKAQVQEHKQENRGKPGKAVQQQAKKNENRGQKAEKAVTRDNDRGNAGNAKNADRGVERGTVARGNSRKSDRFDRSFAVRDVQPNLRRFAVSNRAPERIAAGALSRGHARGLDDDDVVIRQNGDRISMFNRSGVLLLDLDDDRARNLGNWRVHPYYDEVKSGAPSFCRSGEGHPVFGREWCLQKGFGLGDYRDLRWGRTTDVGDIIFRQADRGTLARAVLIDVLGDVVFNRLGLHALTLGYSDPLSGVWLGEPTGPQVLRVSSGGYPIAEFYDGNRDNRADVLVVALRPWY